MEVFICLYFHQFFIITKINILDLWTLSGVVAIEEMGGPTINWKPGRVDTNDQSKVPPNGRLPDATLPHPGIIMLSLMGILT